MGVDLSETAESHTSGSERQGRSCCFCLCDMRRAVIILSALSIIGNMVALIANGFYLESVKDDISDENTSDESTIDDLWTFTIIISSIGIATGICAFVGGLRFNKYLVGINAVYILAGLIATSVLYSDADSRVDEFDYSIASRVGSIMGAAFGLYVHLSFIREIQAGIMSKENYPNEEQSCCCV